MGKRQSGWDVEACMEKKSIKVGALCNEELHTVQFMTIQVTILWFCYIIRNLSYFVINFLFLLLLLYDNILPPYYFLLVYFLPTI